MKKIKYLILSFFCLLLLSVPNIFVHASEDSNTQVTEYHATASITAENGLNVRSGPDKSYDTLGQLAHGTQITITGKTDNGWYQIDYNNQKGFISSKYVSEPNITEEETFEEGHEDTLFPISDLSIVGDSTVPLITVGIVIILILMLITLVQLFQLTGKIKEYDSNNDYEEYYSYDEDDEYDEYYEDDDYDEYDDEDDDY